MTSLSRSLFRFFMLLALIVGPASAMAHPATRVAEQALTPLSSLLQSDGTLNLSTGFQGSVDPRGWAMVSERGQPPRFAPATGVAQPATVAGDAAWDDRFNVLGVSAYVRAIAVSGDNVYVGGLFSAVGGVAVNNVARWNSSTGAWAALGGGVSSYVYAIAVSGSDVYVGGLFNAAGGFPSVPGTRNIAKWNTATNTWSALGGGVSSYVYAIAVSGSDVYVGGLFSAAGGIAANNIATWNTTSNTWSALEQGFSNGVSSYVYAIAISGNDVYVGGLFNGIGGVSSVSAFNIARWNSATHTWSGLGPQGKGGVGGYVYAIAVSGNDVYVGGLFNGVPPNPSVPGTLNIAKWNSTTGIWSALGSGVAGYVYAIMVSGSDVYVGGLFNAVAGVPSVPNTFNIAKWNGSGWSALGSGVSSYVYAIASGADGVYVGGLFNAAGDKASRNFGLWHGTISNPPNPNDVYWNGNTDTLGVNNPVYAIAVSGSDVYVAGDFTMAGGISARNIARWDGSNWSALGSGIGNTDTCCIVKAIAVSGSDVYVGGLFSTAGGISAGSIAKWNGSSWSALGSGVDSGSGPCCVEAIAVKGSDVYVGGPFVTAGGVSALNIAKWNGSSWSALGSGLDGPVIAVAVKGSDVYVGGLFNAAGGFPSVPGTRNIAKWNTATNTWSALDTGVDGTIYAIAVSGNDVYVGGSFSTAGAVSANNIAKWNGTTWSALGSGVGDVNQGVAAIAVSGNDIYVAGAFSVGGGHNLARWDGSGWSALGSGTSQTVTVLTVGTDGVYVGGDFTTMGGKPANFITLWHASAITPPHGGIAGQVTHGSAGALPGARVQVCPSAGATCLWHGTTTTLGAYAAPNLPDGTYRVTAYPPAGSLALPSASGLLTIANGVPLAGQDLQLANAQLPPAGTTLSPSRSGGAGVPRVRWNTPFELTTQGCAGGNASYQIAQLGAVMRSGALTEGPASHYHATLAALTPNTGYARAQLTIQCPATLATAADTTVAFDFFIEPSGTVRTPQGRPVANATVTLSAFDTALQSFSVVPNGDAIMGPVNRTNPDTTNAEGAFGWDLTDGVYKIQVAKAGCVAASDPTQAIVESDVLVVPPVADLDLVLDCGGSTIYMPLIGR